MTGIVEARVPVGLAKALVISFRRGGNSDAFVREGWQPCEAGYRWSYGDSSVLALPPVAASRRFTLTFYCDPAPITGVRQNLTLALNGVALAVVQPQRTVPQALVVPGEIVNQSGDNILALHCSNALTPGEHSPDSRESRPIAFAWRRLELTPDETPMIGEPAPLAEADPHTLPMASVVGLYQSLGQNCELGLFQRRCGAEPFGLLRFASMFPDQLVQGLRTRFAGVGGADNLMLAPAQPGGELMGHHAAPEFLYHTFKNERDVDVAEFHGKEAQRLGYLARMLLEQLDNDQKIFVRRGGFEANGEIWALYRLLRAFNREARLLMVQQAPERGGCVERLAPNLYRGFVSKFADPEDVPGTLPYEDWRKICATLYLEEQRRGRVEPAA